MINCYFQHINLGTGELQFEWSALDHVGLNETFVLPDSTEVSGDGLNPTSPWDYFHINSVDLNSDGDYLISARHTCAVYKVSGQDGHIIWTLGGSNSDFTFAAGLNFSFQHDARFLEENDTTTVISLFDNASNGYNQTARYSAGKILKLDLTTKTVSLIQQFVSPYQFISASQGNVQLLGSQWNTSNAFLGWGENAYISEYTSDGTMVQQGHFATSGTMNYRAFKHNFTTNPLDAPALYAYAHNTSAPTSYWMSWNGATKVAQWQIYSAQSQSGPFSLVGKVNKAGFETQFAAKSYYPWSIVESLDADGNPLKNSTRPIRTFVPGSQLAALCNSNQCPSATTSTAPTMTTTSSTTTSSNAAVNIRSPSGKVGEMAFAAMAGIVPFM